MAFNILKRAVGQSRDWTMYCHSVGPPRIASGILWFVMADTATTARGTNITETVIFKTKGGTRHMKEKSRKFGCL
jgi:hypothetical protein